MRRFKSFNESPNIWYSYRYIILCRVYNIEMLTSYLSDKHNVVYLLNAAYIIGVVGVIVLLLRSISKASFPL